MRIKIEFLKAGAVIRSFIRRTDSQAAGLQLAAEIKHDAGIEADDVRLIKERRVKTFLINSEGKCIETLEFRALDEQDAIDHASRYAAANQLKAEKISLNWLDPEGGGL